MGFIQHTHSKDKDPNSLKYLVMLILFFGYIGFKIYQINVFSWSDEICAHLAVKERALQTETKEESAVKIGTTFLSESEINRQQSRNGCDQRLAFIREKSEKNILYKLTLPKDIKKWAKKSE